MIEQSSNGHNWFWFQREIDISVFGEDPCDIMYLHGKRCVVMLQTKWLLVDLLNPTQHSIHVQPLTESYSSRGYLLPISKDWFGIHNWFLYLVDCESKKIIKACNFADICPNFKYFHQSGKLYKISLSKVASTFYKVEEQNSSSSLVYPAEKILGFADEDNLVITSLEPESIGMTNIENSKITKFKFPSNILAMVYKSYLYTKQRLCLYKINESECILGLFNSLLNEFKLLLINEDTLESSTMLVFRRVVTASFSALNKERKEIALTVSVEQVKGVVSVVLVIYNYEKRRVELYDGIEGFEEDNKIDRGFEVAKRLSGDFVNYVETGRRKVIVHRFRVKGVNLYHHLLSRSGMVEEYGQGLRWRVMRLLR